MRAASQFCHPYCGPQQSRGLSLVRREAAARRQPSRSSSSGSGVATRHGFAHRPRAHLGSARPVVQNETDCASSFCCRAVRALRTLVQRPVSTQNLTPGGAGATSLAQPQRLSTGTEQAVRAASSVQSDRLCLSATAPSRSVQAQHLSVHTSRASPPRRPPSPSSLAPTARHAGRERRSLPRSSSAFASVLSRVTVRLSPRSDSIRFFEGVDRSQYSNPKRQCMTPWGDDEARLAADRKSRNREPPPRPAAEFIARCGRGLATAGRVGQARLAACLDRPPAYLSAGAVCRWRNGIVWGTAAQLVGSACVVCVRVLTLGRSAV